MKVYWRYLWWKLVVVPYLDIWEVEWTSETDMDVYTQKDWPELVSAEVGHIFRQLWGEGVLYFCLRE